MGNLADDTAVAFEADGRYSAELREDWNIWGPNGGYLAAVALRAAGAHSSMPRPASLQCHYLGVASFAPVELVVTTLRASKRAEALRVSMGQGGDPVLEALVWTVADGLDGLSHVGPSMPDGVPRWADVPPVDEQLPEGFVRHRFAANIEERRLPGFLPGQPRGSTSPDFMSWARFRPQAVFDSPFVDACRLAVLVDTYQWPAAVGAHDVASLAYVAPSLDLTCQFHQDASASEWLFVEACSPVAADGLVAGTCRVWDPAGRLVASGSQQMLCRPVRTGDMPAQPKGK